MTDPSADPPEVPQVERTVGGITGALGEHHVVAVRGPRGDRRAVPHGVEVGGQSVRLADEAIAGPAPGGSDHRLGAQGDDGAPGQLDDDRRPHERPRLVAGEVVPPSFAEVLAEGLVGPSYRGMGSVAGRVLAGRAAEGASHGGGDEPAAGGQRRSGRIAELGARATGPEHEADDEAHGDPHGGVTTATRAARRSTTPSGSWRWVRHPGRGRPCVPRRPRPCPESGAPARNSRDIASARRYRRRAWGSPSPSSTPSPISPSPATRRPSAACASRPRKRGCNESPLR